MVPVRCLASNRVIGLRSVFFKQSFLHTSLLEGARAFFSPVSGEDNMNLVLIFCSIALSSLTFCLRQDLQDGFLFPFKDDLLEESEGLLFELMENEGTLHTLPDIEGTLFKLPEIEGTLLMLPDIEGLLLLLVSDAGLLAITESLDLLAVTESPVRLGA